MGGNGRRDAYLRVVAPVLFTAWAAIVAGVVVGWLSPGLWPWLEGLGSWALFPLVAATYVFGIAVPEYASEDARAARKADSRPFAERHQVGLVMASVVAVAAFAAWLVPAAWLDLFTRGGVILGLAATASLVAVLAWSALSSWRAGGSVAAGFGPAPGMGGLADALSAGSAPSTIGDTARIMLGGRTQEALPAGESAVLRSEAGRLMSDMPEVEAVWGGGGGKPMYLATLSAVAFRGDPGLIVKLARIDGGGDMDLTLALSSLRSQDEGLRIVWNGDSAVAIYLEGSGSPTPGLRELSAAAIDTLIAAGSAAFRSSLAAAGAVPVELVEREAMESADWDAEMAGLGGGIPEA